MSAVRNTSPSAINATIGLATRSASLATAAAASLLAATFIALLVPAVASGAAQRFASPTGTVAQPCTQGSPCDIVTAINDAADGDEVIVNPGDYGSPAAPIGTDIAPANGGLDVHGVEGRPRPTLYSNATFPLAIGHPDATLRHIAIVGGNEAGSITGVVRFGGGLMEGVFARGTGASAVGCELTRQALVRDSVCASTSRAGIAVSGTLCCGSHAITLRNVTAHSANDVGISLRSSTNRSVTVTAINTIALGTAADVLISAFVAPATFTARHSSFSTPTILEQDGGTAGLNDDGTNQSVEPLLADPAAGDFRQLPGSPTIDAGIDDPANGALDIDGGPRLVGLAPDIGADELDPAAGLDPPSAPELTLTLRGKKTQPAGKLRVRAACSLTCEVRVRAKGKADGEKFASKRRRRTLEAGARVRLKLELSKRVRGNVAGEPGRVRIRATATDGLGRRDKASLTVRLKPESGSRR